MRNNESLARKSTNDELDTTENTRMFFAVPAQLSTKESAREVTSDPEWDYSNNISLHTSHINEDETPEISDYEFEMKFRCTGRVKVCLENQIYNHVCRNQTEEMLQHIESHVGSRTLVMNDYTFTKSIWEKLKEAKMEEDKKESATRKLAAIRQNRIYERQLPPVTKKWTSKKKLKINCEKKSSPSDKVLIDINKMPKVHGSVWMSPTSFKKWRAGDNMSLSRNDTVVENMYETAEKLISSSMFNESLSKPYQLIPLNKSKRTKNMSAVSESLPKIDE